MKKALLVGVGKKDNEIKESMLELENLALSNEIITQFSIVQKRALIDRTTYVKKGKLLEIKDYLVEHPEITHLIFNDELSANQLKNIVKEIALDYLIISDRTTLILDIFKQRAKTKTAINQVEIAKIQYELAHLVVKDENYDQQRGERGLINRGGGEKQIVNQRHNLQRKIHQLQVQIDKDSQNAQERRKQRIKNDYFLVALVGYTNAGKSTILNKLINNDQNKKVYEKDQLFATLDTSVRKIYLPNNREVLLADTIGFIDRLPHNLVASFKSTLAEALQADLIIHVVDYSNPNYLKHIEISDETLKNIGLAAETKMIYVYNKMDLLTKDYDLEIKDNIIKMSAFNKDDIFALKVLIQNYLYEDVKKVLLKIDYQQQDLIKKINKINDFKIIRSNEAGLIIRVSLSQKEREYYKAYLIQTC